MTFNTLDKMKRALAIKNINDDIGIDENFVLTNDYTHLINPYKDLLSTGKNASGKRLYQNTNQLSYVFSLKKIDDYISLKFFCLIDEFEKRFKSALSNVVCRSFCDKGTEECDDYSSIYQMPNNPLSAPLNCFLPYLITINKEGNNENMGDTKDKDKLIDIMKNLETGNYEKENSFCLNHIKRHNKLPFYIMITSFSFSNLCTLFCNLNFDAREKVYKIIVGNETKVFKDDVIVFSERLSDIRIIRNITHHHEPIVPYIIGAKKFEIVYSAIRVLKKTYINECNVTIQKPEIFFVQNDYNKRFIVAINKVLELIK